jgi:uncharacterized integral membrane protein (TIGR00698 family)
MSTALVARPSATSATGATGQPRPSVVPGLALSCALGLTAWLTHALVPGVPTTLVSVVLGATLAGSGALDGARDTATAPGLHIASRRVLRVGVALLGLQLALTQVLALGRPVLAVVLLVVTGGIAGTLALGRLLGLRGELLVLVAAGFSICGAAAVAAVAGVRRSRDADAAAAVSLVVLCGSVVMVALPGVALLAGLDPVQVGAWAGASTHEVGQVVVAGGLAGGGTALSVAVLVKLGRVLLLAPVVAVLGWQARRGGGEQGERAPLVPGFVVAFVLLAVARTWLPLPDLLLTVAGGAQDLALAVAMAALGCALRPRVLGAVGGRGLALAACSTLLVVLLGAPVVLAA